MVSDGASWISKPSETRQPQNAKVRLSKFASILVEFSCRTSRSAPGEQEVALVPKLCPNLQLFESGLSKSSVPVLF